MQASAVETVIGEPVVERRQSERQRRPALALGLCELYAERGKLMGARPIEGRR